ncbi:MAG TPA: hypothetical protein VH518_09705 [Tepidisphaeraceae bacterium]|jgi:hypothetical protein
MQSFPATHWSLVERASQTGAAGREALATLLHRYLPALRAHLVVEKRMALERVDDLLQSFVADKIIEKNLLEHARRSKGKFRSFLLVTLNRYVISSHRSETAAKRSPGQGTAEIKELDRELGVAADPADQFNVAWARELIAEALRRMQAECAKSQRQDLWKVFEGRVLWPAFEGRDAMDYVDLVRELGLQTPLQACGLLTTAKRMFARNLRAVAGEYAGAENAVDAEISDLRKHLAKGGAESGRPPRK